MSKICIIYELSRCKLVCKQWNSLISDPYFVRHFNSSHRSGELDSDTPLMRKDAIWSFIPVPVGIRPEFRIFDSYEDLVLCGFGSHPLGELFRSYLVCNPFTKQWIVLPVAPERRKGCSGAVARLVCEPLSSNNCKKNNSNLDPVGSHDKAFVYASQYRFRVVLVYGWLLSTMLDVFCSESGEWTKEALVFNGHLHRHGLNVCLFNGERVWSYGSPDRGCMSPLLAAFNPFRLDIPPTSIDFPSAALWNKSWWKMSVSRGVLHVIVFERRPYTDCSRNLSSVWKLEEDGKSWSRRCEGLLNTSWCEGLQGMLCFEHQLHPENPDIVFFEVRYGRHRASVILSCDLRSGEVEHFSNVAPSESRWTVFQPRVSRWPTPIPRYLELRSRYDGSHSWLAQRIDNDATAPSPPQ